jgi:RNA polymerase sigma-70 factor (ECF subfamily)
MQESEIARPTGRFTPTRWTLVLAATARGDTRAGQAALAELCETYWYPLYAYVRRCGHMRHDAEDLTQEFFARLLAKNTLAGVSQEKGRFRSYLLASIKHFLANEWDRSQAQKRGGGRVILSLDGACGESRHPIEPADGLTPDVIFERQWVLTLLDRVLDQLAAEYAEKPEHFAALKDFLTSGSTPGAAAAAANALGQSEGATRVAVHRLRQRYRHLLRAEIAQTVAHPSEVDAEIRRLFSVFSENP